MLCGVAFHTLLGDVHEKGNGTVGGNAEGKALELVITEDGLS